MLYLGTDELDEQMSYATVLSSNHPAGTVSYFQEQTEPNHSKLKGSYDVAVLLKIIFIF